MIFVWCTYVCINVYTCSVQVHEETRGRPLLWFLGHYWPLLHYWHSIYLVCVFRCIYHAINMVEEQKEQESGIRWQAFQLKDQPVTTSSIVRKKASAKLELTAESELCWKDYFSKDHRKTGPARRDSDWLHGSSSESWAQAAGHCTLKEG